MRGTIKIQSSGAGTKPYVDALASLRGEIEAAGVRFEDVRIYEDENSLILTIIGIVGAKLIEKILKYLFEKKQERPQNIKITLIDQSTNITFNLPQDLSKANEHFDKKERGEG